MNCDLKFSTNYCSFNILNVMKISTFLWNFTLNLQKMSGILWRPPKTCEIQICKLYILSNFVACTSNDNFILLILFYWNLQKKMHCLISKMLLMVWKKLLQILMLVVIHLLHLAVQSMVPKDLVIGLLTLLVKNLGIPYLPSILEYFKY